MRYSYEFKRKCVEMYHKGILPDIPDGISKDAFIHQIRKWVNGYCPFSLQPFRL